MPQCGQKPLESKSLPSEVEQPEAEEQPASSSASTEEERCVRAERQKAEEYQDLLRRTQADFVNLSTAGASGDASRHAE